MIGIIGGTGLEKLNIFTNSKVLTLETKYGKPSSEILTGELYGKKIAIISRHGKEHTITPTNVNNRANISALQQIGCDKIIATTACGSLREEMKPGDFVIVNQFMDFTKHRITTFHEAFEPGKLEHCPMAEPYDENLRNCIYKKAVELSLPVHKNGTVITIEGPRFSTKAESFMFRQWGADVINMSTAPETILANEAGIKYAAIAIVTDYDCWKEGEEIVSVELIIENFYKNIKNVVNLITESVKEITS